MELDGWIKGDRKTWEETQILFLSWLKTLDSPSDTHLSLSTLSKSFSLPTFLLLSFFLPFCLLFAAIVIIEWWLIIGWLQEEILVFLKYYHSQFCIINIFSSSQQSLPSYSLDFHSIFLLFSLLLSLSLSLFTYSLRHKEVSWDESKITSITLLLNCPLFIDSCCKNLYRKKCGKILCFVFIFIAYQTCFMTNLHFPLWFINYSSLINMLRW